MKKQLLGGVPVTTPESLVASPQLIVQVNGASAMLAGSVKFALTPREVGESSMADVGVTLGAATDGGSLLTISANATGETPPFPSLAEIVTS